MKEIKIVGEHYNGVSEKFRLGCRAIILKDGKLLLTYEKKRNRYMFPGGGIEPGESLEDCCKREVAEEIGKIVEVKDCVAKVGEYYQGWELINYYFFADIVGETETNLTEIEMLAGSGPVWVSLEDAFKYFSDNSDRKYAVDPDMRGIHYRELQVMNEIFKK